MGHRERLIDGARLCLEQRGYARTTSRDLAEAASAPLGTINYHYGSKDELLIAALLDVIDQWGEGLRAPSHSEASVPSVWAQVIESVSESRPMHVAALEALAQAERSPAVRQQLATAFENARPNLARDLHDGDAALTEQDARAASSVHMALMAGLAQQWLVDPDRAPTAADVARGLRVIAQSLGPENPPGN